MSAPVAIVITAYNRERYLSAAIDSVLAQTYGDVDLLVWDDGSTDRTVDIARDYAARDSRVRVQVGPHAGRTQSLADAIASTNSPYLGWVDSDDLLLPDALTETVDVLERSPSVGMVYTDYAAIDEAGEVLGPGKRCQRLYSKERLLLDFITFHFRLIRRSVYDRVGGINPTFTCAQDYDLCLRLSEATRIYHLRRTLYHYRVHDNTISRQRQMEQIECTRQAIADAMERRGLSERYDLDLRLQPRFSLRPKPKHS